MPGRARRRTVSAVLAAALGASAPSLACAQERAAAFGVAADAAQQRLLVRGSTDLDVFAPLLERFARTTPGLALTYEEWSTNDLTTIVTAQCAGRSDRAPADLVVSSAIDQQIKLVNDGCALPHRSEATAALPAWARWRDEVFGLTLEPAVMVYNRAEISPLDAPQSRFDLIDLLHADPERFHGRIATYDIEASGLGYLFAFADAQQAATFGRLIEAFGRSGMITKPNSSDLIDSVADGRVLVAYNLLGSYALARARVDPRLAVAAPDDYTLVLARAALTPKGAANPELSRRFIDFSLSPAGREELTRAGLIVAVDDAPPLVDGDRDGEPPDPRAPFVITAAQSSLRPIAFSPALLVGLDRSKKALFLEQWRAALAQ